ncbi:MULTISPECIES: DUF1616 domain-containing protein [Methanosarcina]|uniref:DUF1616 domain-containing protein n=3 Tax=Methanosarcina barkeri TaxID=2208 RepID=A0A0E3QZK1_METBA|nr:MULTISPECIES: DUF1616 domain-containing protein [Methanosarcina]AKB56410.1 hypothetical protein MSBRM_3412 [Methanosarcina barkeri MS]AKB59885.1 hypothetical protein MSBR2_3369 [Methanosarcina barkeri 227]AKJ40538.1 hypothetical protein MCM1_3555 [Methanosarcina barkeri CM1]OEC91325.1 hypothetical protein A9239_03300 [Methanosarcina sp. A14]
MTVKKISSDLFIIMGLVLLTDIFVLTPGINETMFRNILGLPLVLFLPGYALIAALFPARSDLDGIERVALSFGLSIAVVPLIGLGLNYTPWGIRTLPILISLSAFTFIMCGLAYLRRASLPESEAFNISFKAAALSLKSEIMETSESRLDRALTGFLIISILLSIVTLAYVVVSPKEGEHFTEFYLLGPEGKADNYTTNYTLGQSGTVIVGVVNHEYRPVNYTMEVTLDNKSLFLPENVKHINLAHNETWEEPVTIMPPVEGKNLKLQFLLFNDTEKSVPYRDLHLWVNVSAPKQLKT